MPEDSLRYVSCQCRQESEVGRNPPELHQSRIADADSLPHKQRAIFIRLLTCQILLGYFPASILLNHFNLHAQFRPLLQAIKWGDRAQYYQHFNKWSEWFRQRGLWLVLREKGEVLVWRSLFRNAWVVMHHKHSKPRLIFVQSDYPFL